MCTPAFSTNSQGIRGKHVRNLWQGRKERYREKAGVVSEVSHIDHWQGAHAHQMVYLTRQTSESAALLAVLGSIYHQKLSGGFLEGSVQGFAQRPQQPCTRKDTSLGYGLKDWVHVYVRSSRCRIYVHLTFAIPWQCYAHVLA